MERRKTPLWSKHKSLGARLIDFGGWDMPVQYPAGTIKEHLAVRNAVGLFDVSHMGEVYLRGPNAREQVDRLTTNNVAGAPVGKAVYTLLCRPDGGVVDDCIFYKKSDTEFFVIVNASNTPKDVGWFREHVKFPCDVVDVSDETALIAVQGPKAVAMVDALAGSTLAQLPSFTFAETTVAGVACTVCRTGYTGEDGCELMVASDHAPSLWEKLLADGAAAGTMACGLAARDTLRLEAAMPLYGHELDEETTPLEADLKFAVTLKDHRFPGLQRGLREQEPGHEKNWRRVDLERQGSASRRVFDLHGWL